MILAWSGAEWANFVDAIASLAVPTVIGVALVLYRKPIRDLIGRNRETKLPGVELKFDPPDPGPIQAVKRQLPKETGPEAEDGTMTRPPRQPGAGAPTITSQLRSAISQPATFAWRSSR